METPSTGSNDDMFKRIMDFFGGSQSLEVSLEKDRSGETSDHDLHIATLMLLIEMAGSDSDIAPEESGTLCQLMSDKFNIPEAELPELVEIAAAARKEHGKIDQFVASVNDRFDDRQRQQVFAMIWKIVLADGKIDKYEERLGKQMRNRLRLSEEQERQAKAMVEKGLV